MDRKKIFTKDTILPKTCTKFTKDKIYKRHVSNLQKTKFTKDMNQIYKDKIFTVYIYILESLGRKKELPP